MTSLFAEPFVYEMQRGLPLLILSCSQQKRSLSATEYVRFCDLYIGPLWQDVKASGFPMTNVAALSALHGFLEPGRQIRSYDREMDRKISHRFCTTSNYVWQLAECVEAAGTALVIGGGLYQAIARAAEVQRTTLVGSITYGDGSFLRQRAQLNAWLKAQRFAVAA